MRWTWFLSVAISAIAADQLETVKALVEQDPAQALEYCRQMAGPEVWPLMLEADVRLGSWAAAERVGEAAIGQIEAGRLFPRLTDVRDEADARRWYAEALDHAGKADQAREQRCMAGQLHEGTTKESLKEAGCAAKIARERDRRISRLKTELLATEMKRPAPPLEELEGHRLEAYRGKVVVAAFWASWCAPCIKELEQLSQYRHRGAVVVPVDIDHLNRDAKRAYVPLPSLEGPEVPQLYVVDAEGNIRFHLMGFEDDGLLARRLDWMIEAVSK